MNTNEAHNEILIAKRTPTDRRYYTYDQYLEYKGINDVSDEKKKVIYTRVSTNNQKDDLKNQVKSILGVFSCKIYGMSKYKKKIKEDEEIIKSLQNRD